MKIDIESRRQQTVEQNCMTPVLVHDGNIIRHSNVDLSGFKQKEDQKMHMKHLSVDIRE